MEVIKRGNVTDDVWAELKAIRQCVRSYPGVDVFGGRTDDTLVAIRVRDYAMLVIAHDPADRLPIFYDRAPGPFGRLDSLLKKEGWIK